MVSACAKFNNINQQNTQEYAGLYNSLKIADA